MNILYVAQCGLPETAPGIRILHIAKLLRENGHSVTFFCREWNDRKEVIHEGFTYLFFQKVKSSIVSERFQHGIDSIFAWKTKKELIHLLKNGRFHAVIIYNDSSGVTAWLLRKAKTMGLKLYADVTEWYSVNKQQTLRDNFYALRVSHRIRNLDYRLDGVIAISPYLKEFYIAHNVRVVEIPPLQDFIQEDNCRETEQDVVTLLYCGSPGTKDDLQTPLAAVKKVNQESIKIRFTIVGINEAELKNIYGVESGTNGILSVGRIPHDKVISYYNSSDFSVLIRRPERYAKAGYSTKIAESLMLGVPVICNQVGGADADIQNGKNGFCIIKQSETELVSLLEMICSLEHTEIDKMKHCAAAFGRKRYGFSTYIETIGGLIND